MLEKKLSEYADKFDDGFPMIPLGRGRSDEEIVKIIDRCIKANKNVYKIGLISDDEDYYY